MPIEKYQVKIRGIRPLLMHRFPAEDYADNNKPTKRVGNPVDPNKEAEKALYRDTEGRICTPSEHILMSMAGAATNFKIPGKGKKTFKDAIKSGVLIDPEMIPHLKPDYKVDIRAVVISRSRIPRARPRFDEWELEFTVTVLDERITGPVLKSILQEAGMFKGIGDYRPRYGLFEVIEFEKVKN